MTLILDPFGWDTIIAKCFPEATYITSPHLSGHHSPAHDKRPWLLECVPPFNIPLDDVIHRGYDLTFVILGSPLFDSEHVGHIRHRVTLLTYWSTFETCMTGTVVLVDAHAYSTDPTRLIPPCIRYDLVLKRTFDTNSIYAPNVKPYPFVLFGSPNPINQLVEKRNLSPCSRISKMIWVGALFKFEDKPYHVLVDRHTMLDGIRNRLGDLLVIEVNKPFHEYLHTLRSYKLFLDLSGCSVLNKRFYEGLSVGTLCMSQRQHVVWPFDNTDQWPDHTQFSTATECVEKVTQLLSDEKLYEHCLREQNRLVEKYFNIPWIRTYITNMVHPYDRRHHAKQHEHDPTYTNQE